MTTLIKLFYAGAIATLTVLVVAYGVRTFYSPPEAPEFPKFPPARPFAPIATPTVGEPAVVPTLTPEQEEYEEAQRDYQERYEEYLKERASYRRVVFLVAAVFGVGAVAAGLALPSRLDAIRLGLVAGGLVTLLYGVVQAGGDLGDVGPAMIFVAAGAGLVLIFYVGQRWLSRLET